MDGSVNSIKEKLIEWYENCLKHADLVSLQFINKTKIDNIARNMNIWRQPVPYLYSSKGYSYSFPRDEIWRLWPGSLSLGTFVSHGMASENTKAIIQTYMTTLQDTLYGITTTLTSGIQKAEAALQDVAMTLQDYSKSVNVDSTFVQ